MTTAKRKRRKTCHYYPDGTNLCDRKPVFRVDTYRESSTPKKSKLYYCARCMKEIVEYNLSIRPFGTYTIRRLDEIKEME